MPLAFNAFKVSLAFSTFVLDVKLNGIVDS